MADTTPRLRSAPLLVAMALLVLACGGAADDHRQPGGEPDITGVITAVTPSGAPGRLGTIRVETVPEDETGSPKASVTITDETIIDDAVQQEGPPPGFEALREGSRVSVWFAGPVLESYPVQATADAVLIERRAP